MRVLYFGTYERLYPRNAQVISCLRGAGVEVLERHEPVWEGRRHKLSIGAGVVGRLILAETRLAVGRRTDADVVVVGYPGHLDMRAARRVAGDRPVVFNPLVSLEDTMVDDRGLVKSGSLFARAMRIVERSAFRAARLVVADTEAHARYFGERFEIPSDRLAVCYVGAEDRLFRPGPRLDGSYHALFVGKHIPLHGLPTILEAARICSEIEFHVVGSGQLDSEMGARPANVRWTPWVDYEQLPELYRSAGCALGVFGTSEKAGRVIPNKVFQALATATPIVTADTAAARELLEHERDALLVPPGDAEALAGAIRRLAGDPAVARRIAAEGRAAYERHATEEVLGRRWRALLEGVVDPSTTRP